jgi:cell division septum initiation protein DivIVA
MSAELYVDGRAARPGGALESVVPGFESLDSRRPNVSGDLPTVFRAAPMFRRAVLGYDRFQVDTYVQWAEDELASAEREHEHLVARHLRTRADLEEARDLLAHSSDGGELLRMSRRIGSMLAAAADEADGIRSEAENCRRAAAAEAKRKLGYARWRIGYAEARARTLVAGATTDVQEMLAGAGRIVDEAVQTRRDARLEAAARLDKARTILQLADEDAGRIREDARAEAVAARQQARAEIVRMLSDGREQRRRADDAAAETRERLAREAATRYASLLEEVRTLEYRRASLRAEIGLLTEPAPVPGSRIVAQLRRFTDRHRWRSRSLRAP